VIRHAPLAMIGEKTIKLQPLIAQATQLEFRLQSESREFKKCCFVLYLGAILMKMKTDFKI
jgi:hypothetical protein